MMKEFKFTEKSAIVAIVSLGFTGLAFAGVPGGTPGAGVPGA